MDDLCRYARRPVAFLLRYVKLQPVSHLIILICVLAAVGFSVSTQYAIKFLVDCLAKGTPGQTSPWTALALLAGFIAADNLLWRVAGWIAASAFVRVTGDLRRALFEHLMGHLPSYFSNRLPGVLTSRVTATSNAAFTIENMFIWNVLPPCVATVAAIAFIATVSLKMAACLALIAAIVVVAIFRIAAKGKSIHHDFADKAAAVDGEITDVVGNVMLVKAFGGLAHERRRFRDKIGQEMGARRRSLLYLEKLRLFHAVTTALLVTGLLTWAILLWEHNAATTGTVVLVCTLGVSILAATRDLAVALVDVTQHMARLAEALRTLLVPHELGDHPAAVPLARAGAGISFEDVSFHYPGGPRVIKNLNLRIRPGERLGLIGPSGGGKSTLLALLQRMHDVKNGHILIDGQDIAMITQESLRAAIAVVPQDISLFHRSLIENIRYSRPDASDEDVRKAAAAAHCDFIKTLPEGFDTIVGDRGLKLSGGQRQRIALARAFLKDSPILLLDEATSALDHESEDAIREASARLMRGRTVIAIAHRLTTLRNFDRIIILRDGEVVHDGPPSELIDANGRYTDSIRQKVSDRRRHEDAPIRTFAIDA
ncbi:ABC transporter ATP-binding protein [uncultured Methylovirgula sp.]|uniref:ABC transporter ATP-binding protein n=1 Tax=uncultured Methylovirgula sp. TaxID=1285960 RepID=UPI0026113BCF|nr:ABC transporter ATP-binding protein [uncultured Methylovirgula sp.]